MGVKALNKVRSKVLPAANEMYEKVIWTHDMLTLKYHLYSDSLFTSLWSWMILTSKIVYDFANLEIYVSMKHGKTWCKPLFKFSFIFHQIEKNCIQNCKLENYVDSSPMYAVVDSSSPGLKTRLVRGKTVLWSLLSSTLTVRTLLITQVAIIECDKSKF